MWFLIVVAPVLLFLLLWWQAERRRREAFNYLAERERQLKNRIEESLN